MSSDSYCSKQKHRCHKGAAIGTWYLKKTTQHNNKNKERQQNFENQTWGMQANMQTAAGNMRNTAQSSVSTQSIIITPGVFTHHCAAFAVSSEEWNVKSRVSGYSTAQISDQRGGGGGICNMKCSRSGAPCFQPQCWMYVTSTEGFSTPDMNLTTTTDKCATPEILKVSKERVLVADAQR